MKNIIAWELRRRRTAIVWWSIGSIVLSVAIMLLYPSIRDQAQELNQALNQLPSGLRGLKTGTSGSVDVADPIAFMNSQLFYATLPIIWIILAITRGSGILGRDEQNHTLELLLARPISRGKLVLAKLISLSAEFGIVLAATLIVLVLVAPLCDIHISAWRITLATLYTGVFSLSFGFIAFTLQALSSITRRTAAVVAVILSFGGYLLASLSGLTDWLKTPAKFMPYHYFNPEAVMHGQAVKGLDIYLLGVLILAVTLSYFGFRRRDIN